MRRVLLNLTILSLAVFQLLEVGCKAPARKNFMSGEWAAFSEMNPTDIVVLPVRAEGVAKEIRFESMRDALRDQMLAHRYSPLAFEYVDSHANGGKIVALSADDHAVANAGASTTESVL